MQENVWLKMFQPCRSTRIIRQYRVGHLSNKKQGLGLKYCTRARVVHTLATFCVVFKFPPFRAGAVVLVDVAFDETAECRPERPLSPSVPGVLPRLPWQGNGAGSSSTELCDLEIRNGGSGVVVDTPSRFRSHPSGDARAGKAPPGAGSGTSLTTPKGSMPRRVCSVLVACLRKRQISFCVGVGRMTAK